MLLNTLKSYQNSISKKSDLIWTLDGIENQRDAFDFLKLFENRLFVYSYMVEKIYSNYSFVFPKSEQHKIAVLPNHQAHHDIFHNIKNAAIENTDIAIFPGDIVGQKNIVIKIPKQPYTSSKIFPLKEGMAFIYALYQKEGKDFLPVISNGDLKEYQNRMPCLYLHNINTKELSKTIAPFQIQGLKNTIYQSINTIINDYKEN